jgi:outer membrane protein OmpA-like peptidoglycan-associated protein
MIHYLLRVVAVSGLVVLFACKPAPTPVEEPTVGDEEPEPEPEPEPQPEPPAPPEDPEDVHLEEDHVTIDKMIQFALDSDEILGESAEILDHLAVFIGNHPNEIPALHVIGHTDNLGAKKYNQTLSEKRAAAVVQALQERGVQIPMKSEGKGNSARLCTQNTNDCHARNRRVEFLIVSE